MYRLARIYGFQAAAGEAAVFLDRLYPRGIRKETMSQFVWLKELAPSTALREWYHQDPEGRFDEFARRYRAELAAPERQALLEELRSLNAAHQSTVLLSAVQNPERSHLSVLRDYLLADAGSLKSGLLAQYQRPAQAGLVDFQHQSLEKLVVVGNGKAVNVVVVVFVGVVAVSGQGVGETAVAHGAGSLSFFRLPASASR